MQESELSELNEYVLSAELVGHDRDVRGICALRSGDVATTSRDNTVRIWRRDSAEGWICRLTLSGHSHFVGPVLEGNGGCVVTGGYDKAIIVWNGVSGETELVHMGHEEAVVALALTCSGDIVSGSWDKTVRVWSKGETTAVLRGHTQAVWGVAGLPNGDIWSASADKTIKIWRAGHCIKTLSEGQDCMRGLHVVPDVGVLSASNDGIVRLYSFEGELVRQLHGHASYVYSVTSVPRQSFFVSGGEDCSVRVWNNSECIQTLQFPSTVWDVAAMANGDLLVACADWIGRVYTRDAKRVATPEIKAAFEKRLLDAAKPKENKVGDLDLENVAGYDALQVDGTQEGQTKVVKKPDGSGAELWKWAGGKWEKVGDVMNAVNKAGGSGGGDRQGGSSGKDYTFPVDMNGQKYNISMNRGDNVYETAVKFIAENDLTEEFLDQIVEFLHANVPDAGGAKQAVAAMNRNQELSYNPSPWGSDPEPVVKKKAEPRAFPRSTYVLFDALGNLKGLVKKAVEFGAPTDAVERLVTKLEKGSTSIDASDVSLVSGLVNLVSGKRFPGLDLLRLLALNESGASFVSHDLALWAHAQSALAAGSGPERMLALRFFCNCVRHDSLRSKLSSDVGSVLDRLADAAGAAPHNVNELNALSVLVSNLAVLSPADAEHKTQLAVICGELLSVCQGNDLLSVVAALGTLAVADKACKELIPDLDMVAKLQAVAAGPAKSAADQLIAFVLKK